VLVTVDRGVQHPRTSARRRGPIVLSRQDRLLCFTDAAPGAAATGVVFAVVAVCELFTRRLVALACRPIDGSVTSS
jgi:hypothetical protein